jgi:putative sugar O-methyltransferase
MATPPGDLLGRRLERVRADTAFQNYEFVKQRVLEMKAMAPAGEEAAPSEYWAEELENIEYMVDAGPLVIERLRQHCYHITGIWPYSYRSHQDRRQAQHETKLKALHELGSSDLFVPEPRDLGGFGFECEGGVYNVDTLKFYEALIALRKGEVLAELASAEEPPIVWEIGGGWGGFAYQFKTVCPTVRYVISDFPELFLFSATYLMTLFPDAKFAFYGADGTSAADLPWLDADFIFMPHTATDSVAPPKLDLTVNMVSFQEMTTEQVRAYVAHAFELESPYLYSLNRDRSTYNPELSGVREIVAEYYRPHIIDVLPVNYNAFPDEIPKRDLKKAMRALLAGDPPTKQDLGYHHVVGWKRILR